MNERLIKIMEYFNYSPSIFADEIGVIRSSISHIISGRNNPGLELLQKVLIRFPKISSDWLLLGRGEMVLSDDALEAKKLTSVNYPKKIGQLNLDDFTRDKAEPQSQAQPASASSSFVPKTETVSAGNITQEPNATIGQPYTQPGTVEEKPAAATAAQKISVSKSTSRIKRITVYFEDQSFLDFVEDKKE